MRDILTIFDGCKSIEDMDKAVRGIIRSRTSNGKKLAKKFPELKGLKWKAFLMKLPMELDFITANEMFDALNDTDTKENNG